MARTREWATFPGGGDFGNAFTTVETLHSLDLSGFGRGATAERFILHYWAYTRDVILADETNKGIIPMYIAAVHITTGGDTPILNDGTRDWIFHEMIVLRPCQVNDGGIESSRWAGGSDGYLRTSEGQRKFKDEDDFFSITILQGPIETASSAALLVPLKIRWEMRILIALP